MSKSWKLIVERDDDGFVKSISLPEEFTEVSDEELSFMDEDEESELKHYGVIGQKWGVRNDKSGESSGSSSKGGQKEERDLNKAAEKAMNLANRKYFAVYNATAKESEKIFNEINNTYSKKYGPNINPVKDPTTKLAKAYWNDCAIALTKSLQANGDRILGSKVDSRIKVRWEMPSDQPGSLPLYYIEKADSVQHAEELDKIKLIPKFDKSGMIISIDFPKDIFEDEESELKHYGVLGQKWGIRKDPADAGVRKTRGSMVRNRRLLSDDQLAATVRRLEMEKKLKELAAEDLAPGRMALNNTLGKIFGTALGAAAGVAGAAIVKQILASKGIKT